MHQVPSEVYKELKQATPEQERDIILRLIEEHPRGRLELPERDGMRADLSHVDLSSDALREIKNRSGLSSRATYGIFDPRVKQAGIEKCRPHDARRSCATTLLLKGVDPFIVSRILGYSQIETTLRYDIRPEQDTARASRLAGIEYLGGK